MDNTLYCGIARDVLARFEEHINGIGAKYTRSHKPESIVYVDMFADRASASKEEYRIKKTLKRSEKLCLIEDNKARTQEILNSLK